MKRSLILCLILTVCMMLPVATAVSADDTDVSGTVPLVASEVSASSIGYYSATISWKTNGDATSQVFYDTESHESIDDYANNTEDTTLVTEHSIALTGLSLSTTYHYRVRSAIPGTEFIASSEDYTFTTATPPAPPPPAGGGGGGGPTPPPPGTTNVRGMVGSAGVFTRSAKATSEDGICTLTIPKGTVGLTEELKPLTEISMPIMSEPPPPPEGAHVIGLAYDFGPDGATFDPPIALEYTYDPGDIPEGVAEEDLVLAYYDEDAGKWVELECVVDTENNTVTASVSHFTTFAIIGAAPPPPPIPAIFSVTNLSIEPAKVQPKEVVTITVSVANTGGKAGSYSVVLKINGVKEAERSLIIVAGGGQNVTFSVMKEDSGSYSVDVDGLSASFTVVAPAPAPAPPVVAPTPPPAPPVAPPVAPPAREVNWPLVGAIIAGVVVAALLGFFLIRKRRA